MNMDFGVVLQTNPPAQRTVQLAQLSEAHGFDYVWTFDSHLLWQEPYVIYSQILSRTNRVVVGPMVTNPATRDWTVTASLFATLNEMFGNRTVCGIGRGDSAVRVTNGKPSTLKEVREATHVIRELANCRPVDYKGTTLQFPWARTSSLEVWVAAYGPLALKAAGEVGDGFILQLADPEITKWMIERVRTAASLADVKQEIAAVHGEPPLVVATSARAGRESVSFEALRREIHVDAAGQRPVLLVFGTGWGLTSDIIAETDRLLAPVGGRPRFNHLSVRSAVAIVLDRLFGQPMA